MLRNCLAIVLALGALGATAHARTVADADPGAAARGYGVVDRIAGGDGGWDYATVDPATGHLFIARSDAITMIDLATRHVTDRLAPAQRAHRVLVLDHGKTVLETDGTTGLARFIAVADGQVLAEIATGAKPDAAFIDPATGRVVVMNAGEGTVSLIDPVARKLVGKIAVSGGLEFGVADGKGLGFVALEDGNAIARIDLVTKKLLGTIALPGCTGPTGLALVAHGTRLIAACGNNVAAIADVATAKWVANLPIGAGPDAVLADEARGLAFIPCGGSGTLVAISTADAAHIAVVATIPTAPSARLGAVDPRDGRIYLPIARFAPPAPGARRGAMIPGSFAVLVIAPGKPAQP